MTIPTRPAPPPPGRSQTISHHNAPAAVNKKPAPPRPPPPKALSSAPVKKSGSQKSISILSNLFGSKNNSKTASHTAEVELRVPPKIPAPPAPKAHHSFVPQSIPQPTTTSDVLLINFDESSAYSPPLIKKTNTGGSDSMSMDSFCSSTSSPNNLGAASQAESGFEDDFSVSDFKVTSGRTTRSTTFSNDPFDLVDDFAPPTKNNAASNIRNVKPLIQPKPSNVGGAGFYACTSSIVPSSPAFDDSLSNGKSLIKPASVSMPTIIKPTSNKAKTSPVETKKTVKINEIPSDESFDDDLPSPPMPSMPPPPPPSFEVVEEQEESYGVALFDFESDVPEDLNLKANEKVYLIKQMNDEWMYGRNRKGCEGIFPLSYLEIRVPLKKVEPDSGTASRSASVSPAVESHRVRALYTFNAETDEDLTIKENEIVNVIYEINPEWLYGSSQRGDYGQFPANFIEYVPQNLPLMPK